MESSGIGVVCAAAQIQRISQGFDLLCLEDTVSVDSLFTEVLCIYMTK